MTALHYSARSGRIAVSEQLIAAGAATDTTDVVSTCDVSSDTDMLLNKAVLMKYNTTTILS